MELQMKLLRLGEAGHERPAVLHDGRYLDLGSITADITGAFLAGPDLERARTTLAELPELTVTPGTRIGAPIARPSAVYCIGMNYAAHALESGSAPPTTPVVFLKAPNTVVGPYDGVQIPRGSSKTDWEVELGVVVGHRASYLSSPLDALDHVAGFVVANDLSERAFQLEMSGGQWSKGKISAGFLPLGPWLVTPDEVDHGSLRLRSRVNGEPRQDSTTADLIFDVATVIHHLSQFAVLEPGDLILTGTPEGVALSGRFPYLRPNDVVELEIEGLGAQRQTMVSSDPAGSI
jgi:2,4-diketo-3-deoxy-L-fuconate hydrolase